jgi:hypothetical protein
MITTSSLTKSPKTATTSSLKFAKLSLWSASAFLILLILLHFIKPDLDPSWHFISEYELGSFGWMMSLAFLSLAFSCITLCLALWRRIKNIAGRIGLSLLVVSAAGMTIAAFFITDPLNASEESSHGKLHQLGAMLDSIPFASVLVTIGLLHKNELWRRAKGILLWSTIFVWIGLILFIVSMAAQFPADGKFGPDVLLGWQNRIMITVQCLWLIIVARQAIKLASTRP